MHGEILKDKNILVCYNMCETQWILYTSYLQVLYTLYALSVSCFRNPYYVFESDILELIQDTTWADTHVYIMHLYVLLINSVVWNTPCTLRVN